jgi:hypothetical protein
LANTGQNYGRANQLVPANVFWPQAYTLWNFKNDKLTRTLPIADKRDYVLQILQYENY